LSTARIIHPARSLAGRVGRGASRNALVSILLAFEKWDRLGVVGCTGCLTVAAGAIVGKGVLSN
jgi:hypothetical protein